MLCCSWSQETDRSSLMRNGGPNLEEEKSHEVLVLILFTVGA